MAIPLNDFGGTLRCRAPNCDCPIVEASISISEPDVMLTYFCEGGHTSRLSMSITGAEAREPIAGGVEPPAPPAPATLRTKAVGVTFANADGVQRQDILKHVSSGDALRLEKVSGPNGGYMLMLKHALGFIGSVKTATIREFCGAHPGCRISIAVIQLTGGIGDKATIGCNIELTCVNGAEGQSLEELLTGMPQSAAPAVPDKLVYLDPTKSVFHSDSRCSGMKGGQPVKLRGALYQYRARPCKKCGANALLGPASAIRDTRRGERI